MFVSTLELLANEILLDIFDYLRPFDIIHGFRQLNIRLQTLLVQRRMHFDLSTNLSLVDFHEYCSDIFVPYSPSIYSIRLSNMEACGSINLFLQRFPQIKLAFPNLCTMSFIEPNEADYKRIVQLKHLTSIEVKWKRRLEQQDQPAELFDIPQLQTCILSYNDVLSVSKLRANACLHRLVLDSFYINDLHTLSRFYPLLQHLTIHRLTVNFQGFLPPFDMPFPTLRTLHLNCLYTVRFDYLKHVLSYFPALARLTILAIGIDFLNSEQWIRVLTALQHLRSLVLDIKAISSTFDDELSSSFLTGFWRQWHVAVDYSPDNQKFHLFTVPYRRSSFISTLHCLPVTEAPSNAFNSITDLYLKTNIPTQICTQRTYPNVRALQIYQNAIVPVNYPVLLSQICSMIDVQKLNHFELFIPLPSSTFLSLIKLTPRLRYFKTDYDILLMITDHLKNYDVCSELHRRLDKFVLRRGVLPIEDNDQFLQIFANLQYLQINLNTTHHLRQIAGLFIKHMNRLFTLHVRLVDTADRNETFLWEGIVNHVSYEIAKRHIKIWK